MNPDKLQDALDLSHDIEENDFETVYRPYQETVKQYTAAELDDLLNEKLKLSGTVAWSTDEYLASQHAKANAENQLWNVQAVPNSNQRPCWWPSSSRNKRTTTSGRLESR